MEKGGVEAEEDAEEGEEVTREDVDLTEVEGWRGESSQRKSRRGDLVERPALLRGDA